MKLAAATLLALAGPAALSAPAGGEVAQVIVIGSAPLAGATQRRDEVAAPVQAASGEEIQRSGAVSLADFLARRLGGVQVNELQGNPFQPDLSYRGYTASPLLGTAQGLSVYLDGLRLNQPFGDVVSWDLIPKAAIDRLTLMPGSNPLFGLNTLGGALLLQTKDGWSHAGSEAELSVARFGRRQAQLEHGGHDDERGLAWYGVASGFHERGWRDHSPSSVGQLFGKFGWRDGRSEATLTLAHARSTLNGNGLQEQRLLAERWQGVYTWPDETRNRASLAQLTLKGTARGWTLTGQAYLRRIDSRMLNGDVDEDAIVEDEAACAGCDGLLTRGRSLQRQAGLGLQAVRRFEAGGLAHRVLAGVAFDASRVRFDQTMQPGVLDETRRVAPADDAAAGDAVALVARTRTASLYAGDAVVLPGGMRIELSARYDRVRVHNRDRQRSAPDPASLDGDHVFGRVNPALGIVWPLGGRVQAYAGANQGSRAPTAIELGCANPEQPCKLPNAMAGDPPLKAVVTRTVEVGLRSAAAGGLGWRVGLFRADNRDDLLFVADNAAGFGYFRNFGRTRRQGLELGLAAEARGWTVDLNLTLLDATYRSAETLRGEANSSSGVAPGVDGTIRIQSGDRLPLLPRQLLKLGLRRSMTPGWSVDLDLLASAGALARGNENDAHQPDGAVYLGPGRSAGYALVNLGTRWQLAPGWQLFAQANNLFDRRYATAAQLGIDAFGGRDPLRGTTFFAPGAPRNLTLGLRGRFD